MATQQTLVGLGGAAALYEFTGKAVFTANSRVGRNGPSLSEGRAGLYGGNTANWKNDTNWFNTSSGFLLWTVPENATYRIETFGIRGGQSYGSWQGGYGVRMRGDFSLSAGEVLKMLVGQQGGSSYGGGGGMVAVAKNSGNVPLIISGSGNGTSPWSSTQINATTSNNGVGGNYGNYGSSGNGGSSNAGVWGGAGFYGNASGSASCGGDNPYSFINGGRGGTTCNGEGGFGGGSATDGCCYGASGAGAGYSGGGGTASSGYGGAGGSYNGGSNQTNQGSSETYGKIEIEKV